MWVRMLTTLSLFIVLTFHSEVAPLAEKLKYKGRCRSDDECNWNKNHYCREPTAQEIANFSAPHTGPLISGNRVNASSQALLNSLTTAVPEGFNPGDFRRAMSGNAATTETPSEIPVTTTTTTGPTATTTTTGPTATTTTTGTTGTTTTTSVEASPSPGTTTLPSVTVTRTTTIGPLPDDGKVVAGVKRCLCLPDTKVDPATKNSPDCISIYAFLDDPCGDVAVTRPGKPKVCAANANLECEDLVPTQFSKCRCIGGALPNIYSRVCTLPPKTIPLGQACRDNATTEEEICEGDYAVCTNGTCVCDVEDPAVAKDAQHGDCYLKVNQRHAKASSASRVRVVRLNDWGNEPKKNRRILEKILNAFCFMCITNAFFVLEEIFSNAIIVWVM